MNLNIRYTIYARHSTDRQNPRSAEDQLEAIQRDVARKFPQWQPVLPFYRDEAVSGTSTLGRSGFLQMIEDAKRQKFDVILVEDVSRFARRRADAVRYREMLADYDVAVLAQSDGYMDPDSESGMWVTGIKELKAQADVAETGRRVRRGLQAKAQQGFATGPAPFGYQRDPVFDETRLDVDGRPYRVGTRLKPDPAAAPIIRKIFELYRSGLGMKRVAARLNEMGLRSARGGTFDQSAIRSILHNEAYIGHIVARKTEKRRKSKGGNRVRAVPKELQVRCDNAHEAVVPQDLWDEVQAILDRRRKKTKQLHGAVATRPHRFLLSGIVKCRNCGGSVCAERSGPKDGIVHYYRCGIRRRRGESVCDNRVSVRAANLERVIVDYLATKVLTPPRILGIVDRAHQLVRERVDDGTGPETRLADIEAKIRRALNVLLEAPRPIPSVVSTLSALEAEKAQLELEIERNRRGLRLRDVTHTYLDGRVHRCLAEFRSGTNLYRKRQILENCFEYIELGADRMAHVRTNPLGTLELVGVVPTDGAGSGT